MINIDIDKTATFNISRTLQPFFILYHNQHNSSPSPLALITYRQLRNGEALVLRV